ncbi:MAG: hypothetical protein AB1777_12440 [Bacteroidota bacterium]
MFYFFRLTFNGSRFTLAVLTSSNSITFRLFRIIPNHSDSFRFIPTHSDSFRFIPIHSDSFRITLSFNGSRLTVHG